LRQRRNLLNDLSGREWIKFTKSWFIHNPPRRTKGELLHPAKFPETLVGEFIRFFTKPGQVVLDPFAGTGSTLVAAAQHGRRGVGVELVDRYATIARDRAQKAARLHALAAGNGQNGHRDSPAPAPASVADISPLVIAGDARDLTGLLRESGIESIDYCITSPPYWNQLQRHSLRQQSRLNQNLDTKYSADPRDLGNISSYEQFLAEQKAIFDQVYTLMRDGGYLTVITNNVYTAGRLFPLAFDTLTTLSRTWVPKDERIWLQDDKRLLPLGAYSAWVGNRHHQYCLILRKEERRAL